MDTNAQSIQAGIALIKTHMPETYAAIQARSKERGQQVFAQVRQGLAGKVNSFYAIERGHVVGTPFDIPGVMPDLAAHIVQFGCQFVIMWATPAEMADGTH